MDTTQMKQAMGTDPAPTPSAGNMTLTQMRQVMNGGSIDPNQSAAALGHSTGMMQKMINFGENALPTIGGIAGGIGGGLLGAAAGIETGPGALVTGYTGAVAGSAAGGAAGEAAKEKLQGQNIDAGNVAKQGAIMGGLEAVGGPIASFGGKVLEKVGGKLATMFLPTSVKEAGQLQAYKAGNSLVSRVGGLLGIGSTKAPATSASTAFEKGLWGTEGRMGVQAKRATSKLWNQVISPALKASEDTVKVNMPKFFSDIEQKIVAQNPELSRQGVLLNALESLKEDYKGMGEATLSQLQKFKEGWAEFVPEKAYKGQPIAATFREIQHTAASAARQTIYEALGPEVKQAYLDYGNLQGIIELGKNAMAGTGLKAGSGKLLHTLYEMATVPAGTIAGQTIYKVGQGIELMGTAGIKTVGGLLESTQTQSEPTQ